MTRAPHQLTRIHHDLLVIGGGVYGACIAWDAALRGLSVALVEKEDFGHATSANTLRVIHGGLRYLKSGDVVRFRRSLRERMVFMRIAPHLVRPLPFLIPTYGHLGRGKALLACAHLVHETARFDRPGGEDGMSGLPRGRVLSRAECLRLSPGLDARDLTGAVIVFDGHMVSSERLLIAILRSAADAGAQLANYVEATGFRRRPGRVTGITARDVLSGSVFDLHARVVVNASGPWAADLLARPDGPARRPVAFSKAFNLLVEPSLTAEHALGVYTRRDHATGGPSAGVGTGVLFLTPWWGRTLIGTAHVASSCRPDEVGITDAEAEAFLLEVNRAYPAAALRRDDVSVRYAGLLPAIAGDRRRPVRLLTRYEIRDHRRDDGIDGLISVIGVKFTESRLVAEETVDLVVTKLGRRARPCATAATALPGAERPDAIGSLVEDTRWKVPEASADTVRRLVARYGDSAREVLKCVDAGRPAVPGADRLLVAEVRHAVREEMAVRLADVVLRRAELGVGSHFSASALETARETMAEELGWDDARRAQEVEHLARGLATRRPTS